MTGAELLRRYAAGERDFPEANLSGADLSEADLTEADLTWAKLSGADLSEADLTGAKLSGAKLSGADLSEADLTGAKLSEADLTGANLTWAKLSGADLSEADLTGAKLSGAKLSGADLTWAKLSGASLTWADLSGANLGGATGVLPGHNAAELASLVAAQIRKHPELHDQRAWHLEKSCGTAHCVAGWAVTLAGPLGRVLEDRLGPSTAGYLLLYVDGCEVPSFSMEAEREDILAALDKIAATGRDQ